MQLRVLAVLTLASAICPSLPVSGVIAAPLDDLDTLPSIQQDDLSFLGDDEPLPEISPDQPAGTEGGQTPENATALQAARAAFQQTEITKCMELLTIAKAKDPSLPPPRLILADMYFQAGVQPAGRQMLERVATENPTHPELWRLLGTVALAERRWTEAIMHFERGMDLPAPSVWTPKELQTYRFSCMKGKAAAMERRGDLKAAAQVLGEMAEMAPRDSRLRDRFASVLFNAQMKDKAYEQFKIAYLRDNNMSPPELSMGIMYVNQGDFAQGDRWFDRALDAHPTNATLHFQIAVALMVQDRATDSAKHSAKAAQLGLDSSDLNMVRGYASRQLRVYDAAERFFRAALEEKPEDAAAMNQLALVLIEQNDEAKKAEALKLATKVFQARENSANAQATLGWVMYRSGRVQEAESAFRKAIQKPSIGPEALYLAGRAFSDQGNVSDAANVAEKLAAQIASPGIYVLRPVARKWLEAQREATPEAIP